MTPAHFDLYHKRFFAVILWSLVGLLVCTIYRLHSSTFGDCGSGFALLEDGAMKILVAIAWLSVLALMFFVAALFPNKEHNRG